MLFGTELSTIVHFPLPALDEQANLVEKHQVESLLFCPNPWAIRHFFVNQGHGGSGTGALQSLGLPLLRAA